MFHFGSFLADEIKQVYWEKSVQCERNYYMGKVLAKKIARKKDLRREYKHTIVWKFPKILTFFILCSYQPRCICRFYEDKLKKKTVFVFLCLKIQTDQQMQQDSPLLAKKLPV